MLVLLESGLRAGQHDNLVLSSLLLLLVAEVLHVRPGRVHLRHLLLAVYPLLLDIGHKGQHLVVDFQRLRVLFEAWSSLAGRVNGRQIRD